MTQFEGAICSKKSEDPILSAICWGNNFEKKKTKPSTSKFGWDLGFWGSPNKTDMKGISHISHCKLTTRPSNAQEKGFKLSSYCHNVLIVSQCPPWVNYQIVNVLQIHISKIKKSKFKGPDRAVFKIYCMHSGEDRPCPLLPRSAAQPRLERGA